MFFKKHIKKIIILNTIIFINISYASFYSVPSCEKGSLTTPCTSSVWEVSGDALYYTSNALDSFVEDVSSGGASTISINKHATDYGWGFRLGTGYHFAAANALLLDWYHYRKTTPEINDNSGRHFDPNEDLSVSSKFDIVNLTLEQKLRIGELLKLGVIEGLQYAHLVSDWRQQATSPARSFKSKDYDVVGPRIAIDANYDIWELFSIFATVGYGVLYYQGTHVDTLNSPLRTSLDRSKRNAIFYETDTSIGVNYKGKYKQGSLESRIAWDLIAYGSNDFQWSGLRFGMKYVA